MTGWRVALVGALALILGGCELDLGGTGTGTAVVDTNCGTCGQGGSTGGGALNFTCRMASDRSSVECSWLTGGTYQIRCEHPAYGTATSAPSSSPCKLDPEIAAPEPRTHACYLISGAAVVAGPVSVLTET